MCFLPHLDLHKLRAEGRKSSTHLLVQLLPHLPRSLPRQRMLIKLCSEREVRRYFESLFKVLVQCVTLMETVSVFWTHTSHTHQMHVWFIWVHLENRHVQIYLSTNLRTVWGQFGLCSSLYLPSLAIYNRSQISGTDRLKINMTSWTFISC